MLHVETLKVYVVFVIIRIANMQNIANQYSIFILGKITKPMFAYIILILKPNTICYYYISNLIYISQGEYSRIGLISVKKQIVQFDYINNL